MKVLLTVPRMNSGGVETHITYLSRGLLQRGIKVVIVCKEGRLIEDLVEEGAIFRSLDVASQSILSLPLRIRAMERIIREEKVDLVHAHSRVPAWIGYYAAKRARIPFITTAHSRYSLHAGSRVMAKGERVIAVSNSVARYLQEGWKLSSEKFHVIPEGIDIEKFSPRLGIREAVRKELLIDQNKTVIGNVGRMTSIKGHRYLVEGFSHLGKNLILLLVGDGRKRADLQELATKLGVADRVIFAGDRDDVPRVLQAMDIYVQSSLAEGLGLAALEAMAAGLPVILTNCGGLAEEITPGKEALLVPPGEVKPIAKSVNRLLEDEDLRRKLQKSGQEFVAKKFSPKIMVEETINLYNELLAERGGSKG